MSDIDPEDEDLDDDDLGSDSDLDETSARPDDVDHTLHRVFGGEPIALDGTVSGYVVDVIVHGTVDMEVYHDVYAFCGSVELAVARLSRALSENILFGMPLTPSVPTSVRLTPTRVVVDRSRSTPDGVSRA